VRKQNFAIPSAGIDLPAAEPWAGSAMEFLASRHYQKGHDPITGSAVYGPQNGALLPAGLPFNLNGKTNLSV
jgi:hypothetical protein